MTSAKTRHRYRVSPKSGNVEIITANSYDYDSEARTFAFDLSDVTVFEISRDEVLTIQIIPPMDNDDLAFDLGDTLREIEDADTDYDTRYGLVLNAMALARKLSLPVGIRIDEKAPEWPTVYIELPTGQVSWHMPQHPTEFDGHDTAEKYARCRAYAESVGA